METFGEFLERKELRWPGDCNVMNIARHADTPRCYVDPRGPHLKVKDRALDTTVTVVPKHRQINPYTCKAIIRDIEKSC
jgi:hypothetical protein